MDQGPTIDFIDIAKEQETDSELTQPSKTSFLKLQAMPIQADKCFLQAFYDIKKAITEVSLLSHPCHNAPFKIMTNASDTAVGAVLQQVVDNQWQSIAFFCKKFTPAETRYSIFHRELLAVYLAIKHFQHLLKAGTFTFSLITNSSFCLKV